MITTDAVRRALASPQPWSALDELVVAELAAGRLTDQLHGELITTLDEIRAEADHDEDTDEPLLDTLDRLSGNCRAELAYRNPPVLPTDEEIAKLPRWARVAFAARCARRVLPSFRANSYPEPDRNTLQLLAVGVARAESGGNDAEMNGLIGAYKLIHSVTLASAQTKHTPAYLALNVANAVSLAVELRIAANVVDTDHHARGCLECVGFAKGATANDVTSVIRRDFDHLARLAYAYDWTDDTPVPPEVFGPLWPEGKPAGWPDDPQLPRRTDIALEMVAAERATEEMIEDEVVNLFLAMNRFHIARTGQPLTVEDFQPFLTALVPAGV